MIVTVTNAGLFDIDKLCSVVYVAYLSSQLCEVVIIHGGVFICERSRHAFIYEHSARVHK